MGGDNYIGCQIFNAHLSPCWWVSWSDEQRVRNLKLIIVAMDTIVSRDQRFMLAYSFLLLLVSIGDLALFLIAVIQILIPQCDASSAYHNEYAARNCSYRVWFAGKRVVTVTNNQSDVF